MNKQNHLKEIIQYWMEKSSDSFDAAHDELQAGRLSFTVNRIYYACFYAVSAVLIQEGLRFKKHSGVRAAFHQHFVKTGRISYDHGRFYDEIFEARQRGDYIELVRFEREVVKDWLIKAERFIKVIQDLVKKQGVRKD